MDCSRHLSYARLSCTILTVLAYVHDVSVIPGDWTGVCLLSGALQGFVRGFSQVLPYMAIATGSHLHS